MDTVGNSASTLYQQNTSFLLCPSGLREIDGSQTTIKLRKEIWWQNYWAGAETLLHTILLPNTPERRRIFNMFEITYNDSDMLQNYIDADKAYHGAIYDFTFEGRFLVYHFFVKDTARYVALDSNTGYGSEVTRRRKEISMTSAATEA